MKSLQAESVALVAKSFDAHRMTITFFPDVMSKPSAIGEIEAYHGTGGENPFHGSFPYMP